MIRGNEVKCVNAHSDLFTFSNTIVQNIFGPRDRGDTILIST